MIAAPAARRLSAILPQLVLAPSLVATFIYVFVFCGWTIFISLSDSSLLPDYSFAGFHHYAELWANRRWNIAYTNLFVFGTLYVVGATAIGLALAILIDQRIRAEALWRTIYLYPLAVSFVVTGTVWRWILSPATGIESIVHHLGWMGFRFDWIVQRDFAIYTVVITGIWQASGFVMALFLAGLRSVDQDLVKAAQIDGAGMARIYRKIILPGIGPIFIAVLVVLLQFAIKTFDLVYALTGGGPGVSTTVPAIYVYDLMFQRGQMAEGAAAAIMILAALSLVLVPYTVWVNWRRRGGEAHG
ncbi:MAG: sugar ABC transporter permease [Methylobacteriaceae bacterium]|nr:sugar ABC transporter permease [Methylobacteriaceae bacterium]MBV9703413.1 sugar ABC transporter permease [Methylobacteriaceae bacterium]